MANRVSSNPGSDVTISRIAANGRDKNIHPLFMQPRNAKWGMAFVFDSFAWHLENICLYFKLMEISDDKFERKRYNFYFSNMLCMA